MKSKVSSEGFNPVEAGFSTAESIDVSVSDQAIAIADGLAKGLYVGVTGDIELVTPNGETITYKNVPVGQWAFPCTQINNAGTTASEIIAGSW